MKKMKGKDYSCENCKCSSCNENYCTNPFWECMNCDGCVDFEKHTEYCSSNDPKELWRLDIE